MEDQAHLTKVQNYSGDENISLRVKDIFILKYSVPINGYISPVVILLTIITNSLVIAVLLRKEMRTTTNCLLVGIALAEMITGVVILPVLMYFFTMGRYEDYIPFEWCYAYKLLYEVVPTIFHTATIWLTVMLAIQRYLYVCQRSLSIKWCTIKNVVRAIILVYILSVSVQIPKVMDFIIVKTRTHSITATNTMIDSCTIDDREWVADNKTIYYNTYFWFRIVFIQLVPCGTVLILNGIIISTMKKAQERRRQFVKETKNYQLTRITYIIVLVMTVFLLVELSLCCIMVIYVIDTTFALLLFSEEMYSIMISFSNLFILISYPCMCLIYCGMSHKFRETFQLYVNTNAFSRTRSIISNRLTINYIIKDKEGIEDAV